MKLDIDTTIGWGDKTLAAFAVKGFDNSCHFTGQKNSLILIESGAKGPAAANVIITD